MQPPKKGPFFRPSNGNGIIKGANSTNPPRKRPGPRQIQPPPKGPSFKFAASPFRFERVIHEETKHIPVARLAHGLDRVLFSPGVHVLQDTRTKTFNFDPILQNLAQPDEFNFDALPAYKIASGDPILREVTESQKQKYFSSTSSITSVLAQFYHVLTENRGLNISEFSLPFADQPRNFTSFQRKPHSIILKHHNGIYSIDQEKAVIDELEEVADDAVPDVKPNEILMQQGKSMEKLLTAPKEEYETYLKSFKPPPGHTYPQEEAFHYANIEGFLLRSQLDCHHPSLGTFDIKTRATVAIRMDPANYRENTFYKLTHPHGLLTSYERELHDTAAPPCSNTTCKSGSGAWTGSLSRTITRRRCLGLSTCRGNG
ncbi:Pet127-domain-containing protein [Rhizoclosmatium globosum]|uniref:Pet127-domain-containing protein n=1 Tax=Rhizoclosmatium globosum TaxID=329046 RepID=A0A1Y2B512_9FUNG|nr:Pet127-domain-containing protein [Rhizoclosmatium globosum]|eukprot:ORY29919.1 Pet127-domain-containing protein [Rhizoclosmatium globosum]